MTAPSFRDLFRVFGRIGVLSFGGPAAQIALMHRELVEERSWLSEAVFLRALSLCMLLPGPEAMQLATYAGWRLRGIGGGLVAGLLFVLPGAAVILVLALFYAVWGRVPLVQAAFLGIKSAVIVIVLQALLKLARRALGSRVAWALAGAAFLALFVFGLPFPLIVLVAGLLGAVVARPGTLPEPPSGARLSRSLPVLLFWGGLWLAPLPLLWVTNSAFLLQLGLFFSKLAVVTFGGAYAVLAYMTQTVVTDHGWISTAQMIDALGLAETTPGPLILVTEFVALLAGYLEGGFGLALVAGALALWVTFVPCFLWIFLAGPYLDAIAGRPRLSGALDAITAAVVGVILNLALWFGMHVLFAETRAVAGLPLTLPVVATLDIRAAALTVLAAGLMLGLRRSIGETLLVMAVAGILTSLI
ncbi:chromate efflux transporter [Sulfitobacter sp. D35]|uniref:chromate efflux transporter n=1 Tax=Sulfitobacter sp. D35 TaxID=3083252 RepID=UPI00296F2937|nr:chromate efflux transporter [Sulfitobacter sp. D35]MDW4496393.1 chromate efflux transporter [Sulfitobacter sp. D35]